MHPKDLTIKKGDIYGLIGKNGAGKTTLIKVITQLLEASSGNISLFGSQNYQEWTQSLKRVGSVIETPVAHNHLTAYENRFWTMCWCPFWPACPATGSSTG